MAKAEWTKEAVEDLEKLDKVIAKRIIKKVSWFVNNFEKVIPEPLHGEFSGTVIYWGNPHR